ncbi:MAG: NAD(P)/FAD-dependent oxidoreductase [Nannocystaceae bacterium]
MKDQHVVIIGGGLAGLSAGCYALASGFRATILEHNIAPGGVCTAWQRGPYLVDGCIHWLTGGPFDRVYAELGVLQALSLRPMSHFMALRDASDGAELSLIADLDRLAREMIALAPEDRDEIGRIIDGARRFAEHAPPFDKPRDLYTLRDGLRMLWEMRHDLDTMVHFRSRLDEYADRHLKSPKLRGLLTSFFPVETPALFLLMTLGYLSRGWLSRPVGGTAAFRDAIVHSFTSLGGDLQLHTTVDEVLVDHGRARGVRLQDGSIVEGDAVVCTASAPETIFRLLGGRYEADATARRMREWRLFAPIVFASYGVATPLEGQPQLLHIHNVEPFTVGDTCNNSLSLRICNDDPCFAPAGHTVVQAMLMTSYDWWAKRGAGYNAAKDEIGARALEVIDRHLPGVAERVRMTDISTPLTYWNMARSWRGAFEGWMPRDGSMFETISQRIKGLSNFYMAGQWVEPGGGVPTACSSGRSAAQLLCADRGIPFVPPYPQ